MPVAVPGAVVVPVAVARRRSSCRARSSWRRVVGAACGGGGCAGGRRPVLVADGGGACELTGAAGSVSLVSATKAIARAMPASTAMTASTATGARQLGVGTSRVRAGAPQARHQAWSGPIAAAQRGQAMVPGAGGAPGGATLTARRARRSAGPPAAAVAVCGRVGGLLVDLAHDLGRLLAVGGRPRLGAARLPGAAARPRGATGSAHGAQRLQVQRRPARAAAAGGGAAAGDGGVSALADRQAHGLAHLGDRARPVHRRPARRAEAGLAAVQRAAARAHRDAGLAQLGERAAVVERVLEGAQLAVDGGQRGELAVHERLVDLREAVLVEDEAAEVAEAELAHAAQVAQAPAQAAALAEARAGGNRLLAGGDLGGGLLLGGAGAAVASARRLVGGSRRRGRGQVRRWAAPRSAPPSRPARFRPRWPDARRAGGG